MLLPKDISNNFTKTMFSLRDMTKMFQIGTVSKLLFLGNPDLHNTIDFFNKNLLLGYS